MPIIYTYPKVTPAVEDLVIISDASETNPANATRQCTISDILAMGTGEDYDLNAGAKVGSYIPLNLTSTSGTDNSVVQLTEGSNITLTRNSSTQITIDASSTVSSVSAITPGTSTGSPIVITPTTGAVEVKSMAFAGDVNIGHVPDASAAAGTSYLKNDGTWATPPDTNTTYSMMTDTVLGLGKLEDNTVQTTAANAVTTTASRTYGIQKNSSDQLVVNVPWTDSGGGTTFNGWDVLNFAQGEVMSANATILYFYQVVVPEPFTANKAKLYVTIAGGASTIAVSIYSGLLSNLAGTTKLGDGTINPTATGIVEVPLTQVSPGDLDLTAGQNIILGFSQSIGDKMLCINNRIADSNLAISSTTALPFPSTLSGLEEQATSVLRPCCVLYK